MRVVEKIVVRGLYPGASPGITSMTSDVLETSQQGTSDVIHPNHYFNLFTSMHVYDLKGCFVAAVGISFYAFPPTTAMNVFVF